ncbi:MAG: ATP-binding cassette domain-containing protein [Coriobacteriales bacterium]|jgi:molybdate transport system ATP-binding protein|nr:ATP-binding cassette domain-containing protein [Coriobacteriales bacterium]
MTVSVNIRKAFREFTLDVAFSAETETLGFLGASGSGKSLTLRCIAGLEKPDEGRIVVGERVFFDSEKGINLTPQERKTALLFQSYLLFPNLTVAANIRAGLPRGIGKQRAHDIVSDQLARFGLKGFGHRYPASLSGGQQQRVALARMLAAEPQILMLDEPFSALDAHLKSGLEQDLLDLFDEFDGTILYISHDIDEAFRFCDRVAIIDEGRLQQLGAAAEILARPATLATLKVSGVKNITPVHPLGPESPTCVRAEEWGLTLECGRPVPSDTAWLGVRATYLEKCAPPTPGDLPVAGMEHNKSGHRDGSDTEGRLFGSDTEGRFFCSDTEGRFFCVPGNKVSSQAMVFPGTQKNRPSVSEQKNRPSVSEPSLCPPRTDEPSLCPLSCPANVFPFTVRRVIDSRFERTVILEPGGLIWRFPLKQMPAASLPKAGDLLHIFIPPEHIYLVAS